MTREAVLDYLWERADRDVSGEELARALRLSRTAVWKSVEALREDGYRIDSAPRRGYRLCSDSDVLSGSRIEHYLRDGRVRPEVRPSLSSTNTVLKALAAEGAPEGLALIAGEQTAGRGRLGRSFYSPPGCGLYLSLLLRPRLRAEEAVGLTACAAVAAAEAIEEICGKEVQIKWVNDLLIGGRKVCGILTEASLDCESGRVDYAVVGVGINVYAPPGGFPEELRGRAGAVLDARSVPELRCRLAASLLRRLIGCADDPGNAAVFDAYRSRSAVLGRPITILSPGREPERATALDLERDFALLVRTDSGEVRRLQSGEISIRT